MSDRTAVLGDTRGAALPGRADSAADLGQTTAPPPFAAAPERLLAILAIVALVMINVAGFFAAVMLIALSLLIIAVRPGDSVQTLIRFSPLLALPLLAAISTLWSDAPARTLKASLELILTVVAAILMCRNASPRTLILIMFAALLPICLSTMVDAPRAIANNHPMYTYLGSKNHLGMMAQMLAALSMAIVFDRKRAVTLRWLGFAALALAVLLLVLSRSTTAQVCTAITAVIFPALMVFGRLPLAVRLGSVALLFVTGGLALPFIANITSEIEEFRGSVLNKDATLTGRTYLWEVASQISAERPLLGHGYSAFWRVGNLDAEALWRWGGVANRSGFNFHNAVVEMQVDLGLVGVVLLALTCAAVLILALARQVLRPSVPMAFIVTIDTVFYIRSYSEIGLLSAFSFLTALWLGGAIYAVSGFGNAAGEGHTARSSAPLSSGSLPRTGIVPGRHAGQREPRKPGPPGRRS